MGTNLGNLDANARLVVNWTAQANAANDTLSPTTNFTTLSKTISFNTATANNTSGGADELYSAVVPVGASGNASVDLLNFQDVVGQNSVALARVKYMSIQLLSTTDDTEVGSNAASISYDATTAGAFAGFFANATSKPIITNGGFFAAGVVSTGGSVVNTGAHIVKIINNDAVLTASALITIFGGTN